MGVVTPAVPNSYPDDFPGGRCKTENPRGILFTRNARSRVKLGWGWALENCCLLLPNFVVLRCGQAADLLAL